MEKIDHLNIGNNKSSQPINVDAKGSQCPGPVMSLSEGVKKASIGDIVTIEATDPGFITDAKAWSAITGNPLLSLTEENNVITGKFKKLVELGSAPIPQKEDSLTFVIFSEDMDKAIAAFNIVLGAVSMGMKVQIFFTFWGLNLIKKKGNDINNKDLPISQNNYMGLGAKMIERLMKKRNITSLDFMIHLSKMDGVKFVACQMTMSLMNVQKEELMDGVEVGGVATMLEYARKSNLNYII